MARCVALSLLLLLCTATVAQQPQDPAYGAEAAAPAEAAPQEAAPADAVPHEAAGGAPHGEGGATAAVAGPADVVVLPLRPVAPIETPLLSAARAQRRMRARLRSMETQEQDDLQRHVAQRIRLLAATQGQIEKQLLHVRQINSALARGHQLNRDLAAKQRGITEQTHGLLKDLEGSVTQQHESMSQSMSSAMQAQNALTTSLNAAALQAGQQRLQTTVEATQALAAQETRGTQVANQNVNLLQHDVAVSSALEQQVRSVTKRFPL